MLIISENRKNGKGLPGGQEKYKLVKRGNISLPQKKNKISINNVSLRLNRGLEQSSAQNWEQIQFSLEKKLFDSPAEMFKTGQIFIIKAVRQAWEGD